MFTFKELLFTGPEAVCLVDMDFRIIEYNQITNILLGLDDDDLNGKNLSDIFYDDKIIQNLTKTSKQDHWFQGECLVKTSSEIPLSVKFRAGYLQNGNSQQEVYALIFREIDELQHTPSSQKVNALKPLLNIEQLTTASQSNYSESLLQIAFDVIKQPIVAVNKKGLITKVNNSAKAFYGFTELEMLGKSFGDLVFLADHTVRFDDLLNTVIEENSIYDKEITHIRSDFSMVDISISAYPYKSDDGTINGAVFVIQDIRQQNQLKSKMAQLEKLSVLEELLYSAANELNNSLTSVIGHSELLCHTKNEEIASIASKIHKGSLRCGNVVAGLLELARDDKFKKNNSSLDEVLKSALDLKRYQLQSNNIYLSIKVEKNIPQITFDFHELERLILHIINYAERRMLEYEYSGELSIEAKFDNGKVIICFTDTGTCILKHDMNEILSCFYAPSESNEYIDIGLVSSCHILEKIGGTIHIDSRIGKKNIIKIEIPAVVKVPIKVSEYKNGLPAYKGVTGKGILLV
ncbi:MAG: hybrid sensor histidine kinase/response regulator, partial [Candidatus Poribacteria bacterium]|nr:hybrid sensor histidine kinase/response regulator [Candidatus Poribacteria bacterium]